MPHECPMIPALNRIIDYLLTDATEGIRGVHPDGLTIRIFIYMVAMMGDPSKQWHLLMSSDSQRTHYARFVACESIRSTLPRRQTIQLSTIPVFSLVRFHTRRQIIRACNPDKHIVHKLGRKTTFPSGDLPAVYFS